MHAIFIEAEIRQFLSNMHSMMQASMSDDKLVRTKIRETFERAFWNSLLDDMCAIPCSYTRVLRVLDEICSGIQVHQRQFTRLFYVLLPSCTQKHSRMLLQGLSQGHPEHQKIQDVVDLDFITQQLKNDAFSYGDCTRLIDDIINVSMKPLFNLSLPC